MNLHLVIIKHARLDYLQHRVSNESFQKVPDMNCGCSVISTQYCLVHLRSTHEPSKGDLALSNIQTCEARLLQHRVSNESIQKVPDINCGCSVISSQVCLLHFRSTHDPSKGEFALSNILTCEARLFAAQGVELINQITL